MPGNWKFLDYKNRQDGSLNQDDLPEPDCESSPVVFPDEDTPVKVVFEASLADFTKMLSALEKGAQLSYPNEWHAVWWNFVRNWECQVTICDEVAECLTSENPAVVAALAQLIASNQTILDAINAATAENGGGTPGKPISDEQAAKDTLPENTKNEDGTCKPDELWGGILYLVQSGNRAITDVFEIIESASNTLENMEIISRNIPAAGDYIASAAAFADQLQEVIAEGYSAAYTETFEENLACAIFCFAQNDCSLSVDDLVQIMNNRLSEPLDLGDFGEIMAGVATGTWVGDDIANVSFLLFFGALRYGQQFGGTVGIRPLDILMSLGADQLASDNWMSLCTDCPPPEGWSHTFNDTLGWGDWTPITAGGSAPLGTFVTGGIQGTASVLGGNNAFGVFVLSSVPLPDIFKITVTLNFTAGGGSAGWNTYTDAGILGLPGQADGTDVVGASGDLAASSLGVGLELLSRYGAAPDGDVFVTEITVSSDFGSDPY